MDSTKKKVRYGVVGIGHIAQTAVIPAFSNAKNSVLTTLVSGDLKKQRRVAEKFKVQNAFTYDQFAEFLEADVVDAVYISLPNHLHHEFSKKALKKGIHVLCEKPLALKESDCLDLIQTAEKFDAKLMTAYRLHFEPANRQAIQWIQQGKVGNPRYFSSQFSFVIQDSGNIRLKNEAGGGPLWDIGVYCLNTARNLFQSEPIEVVALAATGRDIKFQEVDETFAALLKFPEDRVASFVVSFGAKQVSRFQVYGTKGSLEIENSYEYLSPRKLVLTTEKSRKELRFPQIDQFGPEISYFSKCILENRDVGPSGREGLADVRVIEALIESASIGRLVDLEKKKNSYSKDHSREQKRNQHSGLGRIEASPK